MRCTLPLFVTLMPVKLKNIRKGTNSLKRLLRVKGMHYAFCARRNELCSRFSSIQGVDRSRLRFRDQCPVAEPEMFRVAMEGERLFEIQRRVWSTRYVLK